MAHQTKDLFLLRRLRLLFLKILRCRIVRLLRLLRLPIATAYRTVANRAPKTANPTTCDRQYYTFEYYVFQYYVFQHSHQLYKLRMSILQYSQSYDKAAVAVLPK